MTRTAEAAMRWAGDGTRLFLAAASELSESSCAAPSRLPGWSRKNLIGHVAANAEGIGRLVHWAATGEVTPMYASAEERQAGIDLGVTLTSVELGEWLGRTAEALELAMAALTDEQWGHEVVTAQGRTVPATEVPWMRAREVYVHAVDLGVGVEFGDLPDDFNAALCEDICAKRGFAELPATVVGEPRAQVTAWLAGRAHSLAGAPPLSPWL